MIRNEVQNLKVSILCLKKYYVANAILKLCITVHVRFSYETDEISSLVQELLGDDNLV